MASSEKRCHYEILGLSRDCTPEEIRSAYKKLALQRHPDKLIQTGVPPEQATSSFQELVNAYEVLSDPRERQWYDSHRSQILFSDSKSSKSSGPVPDLFSFFSNSVYSGFSDKGKGFYKVYGDVFDKIYRQEVMFAKKLGLGEDSVRVSPLIGNLESEYSQVSAFYGYWLGFVTVMDFCWVDEYDAMAGVNRKSRRVMEEENKKLRKKARREYNDTVRGLAEFVKKRDKRVIDMQVKRAEEMEKKREEEKRRKKELEREKLERARLYEEPEWARVDEEEIEDVVEGDEDDERKNGGKELYCAACSKKFKSDKQWKNHEQSKKHKEKVAELREQYGTEEEEEEEEEEEDDGEVDDLVSDTVFGHFASVDELSEQFENDVGFGEEKSGSKKSSTDEEEGEVSNADNGDTVNDSFEADEESKGRASIRKKKKKSSKHQPELYPTVPHLSDENEEVDLMEYNSRRKARRNRASKKSKEEPVRTEVGGDKKEPTSNTNGNYVEDGSNAEDTLSHISEEADLGSKSEPLAEKNQKVPSQQMKKKDTGKGNTNSNSNITNSGNVDMDSKTRNTSKRKKQRGASKKSVLSCETCGEDFESRNKLHKHLSETGHAAVKSK